MKKAILMAIVGCICLLSAVLTHAEEYKVASSFHNCTYIGGSGNAEGYQTASEIYKCDEGNIEIKGRWSMAIEYGYVFRSQLGRPDGEPYRADDTTYEIFKWCDTPKPWDQNQKELCGLNR